MSAGIVSDGAVSPMPTFFSGTGARTPRGLRSRLAEIDAEMADLHARFAHLATERKPIVEALRSVIYPVLNLPAEITAEIFMQYVTSAQIGGHDPNIPHAPGWVAPCGPLLLASVCRAWRDIALALRPIWSKIHIVTSANAMGTTEKLLQCLLPRTGNHPLRVSLCASSDALLLAFLAPYFHQMQSLLFCVDAPTTFPNDLIRGQIPFLQRLDINLAISDFDGPPTLVTAFADAPQLREVVLTTFTLPWIALPWGQLTHLEFSGQYTDQCVDILRHTTQLETLLVDVLGSEHLPAAPVRLDHLHTLKFNEYQWDLSLLDHIILPALTHIEFAMSDRLMLPPPENPAATQFITFVARSGCALRSITLIAPNVSSTIACLRAAPTLAVVNLQNIDWHIHSFIHLFRVLREVDFLPNLQSLSLKPCVCAIEIPYGELAALLASRWQGRGNGSARLESFELVLGVEAGLHPTPTVAELDQGLDALRALEADGLKINIRNLQKMTASTDAVAVYPAPPRRAV
ncbi:hypothetical protein B0H19DRAFT_1271446 [Mycena capillaripes]|nr:hypothetical protein B0H19DRAFT_1271446 [Mycena capillaripes]